MRKIVALLLALTMLCVSALAVAESSPSTETIVTVVSDDVIVTVVESPAVAACIEAVAAAVAAGAPAVSVYAEETQAAIAALVPDVAALELAEVVALDVDNYEAGEVKVTMEFATKFAANQNVIVVITADDAEYVCDGVVTEAGDVEVTLTEEVAAAVAAAQEVVASVFAD